MLNFIRERITGWLAYAIVGLLIIPFALWGINEYFGNGGKLVVANVNDTEISQRDFQQAFYIQRDRGAGRPTKKERRLLDDLRDS